MIVCALLNIWHQGIIVLSLSVINAHLYLRISMLVPEYCVFHKLDCIPVTHALKYSSAAYCMLCMVIHCLAW